jgi:hypothetical protein
MGDLNADLLKPTLYPGNSLKAALKLADTSVKETFPSMITRTSQTCLDIIAIPNQFNCSLYRAVPLAAIDHFPIEASIRAMVTTTPTPVLKRSYRTINYDHMKTLVSEIQLNNELAANPDKALNHWHSSMLLILEAVAPLKSYPMKRIKLITINADIKLLLDHRRWLANKVFKDPNNVSLQQELRTTRKRVKSNIQKFQLVPRQKMLSEFDTK